MIKVRDIHQKDISHSLQSSKTNRSTKLFYIVAICLIAMLFFTFLFQNSKGQIGRILYKQSDVAPAKEQYKTQLSQYFEDELQFDGLKFAQSNFEYSPSSRPQMKKLQQSQYQRLNREYHLEKFTQELPFCIIVQRLNILDNFSYELTLNSIFNQNYSNYKAIILHQPETQGFQIVQKYLKNNKINQKNYAHIVHNTPKSILRTIYDATHEHCSPDSISFPIHRSGQLLGKNVLKVYNVLYQINNVGLIYSDYYRYSPGHYLKEGSNYNSFQRQLSNIRREVVFITNAFTYRTSFFLKIPKVHLLGDEYTYYDIIYEQTLLFPLVQMMCGIVFKINQHLMLTKETFENYNDYLQFVEKQKDLSDIFRNKDRFACNDTYARSMRRSFFIKSLNDQHLKDKQLAEISNNKKPIAAAIKHSYKIKVFQGNPRKSNTRKNDEYLYKGTDVAEFKREYEMARIDCFDDYHSFKVVQLAKYNLFLGTDHDGQYKELQTNYERQIQKTHQLSLYNKYQVPLCIVIGELPERVGEFRFEYLLNSIFTQEYSNYFVVINNRNPTLDKFVRKYLHLYNISKEHYAYISHPFNSTPLQAIHKSLTSICHPNSFSMILSGKEELLGRKVFKIFSSKLRQNKYQLLYGSGQLLNQQSRSAQSLTSKNYTLQEKKGSLYRHTPIRFSHLVTFKTKMFLNIKQADLKDDKGQFFQSNWQQAIFFPLLELSCQLNGQIEGGLYVRLRDLSQNDQEQSDTISKIRNMKKYQCIHEQQNEKAAIDTKKTTSTTEKRTQRAGIVQGTAYKQLDLLQINSQGQTIVEYLYGSTENVKASREKQHNSREKAVQKLQGNIVLELSMFNLKLDHTYDDIQRDLSMQDYQAVNAVTQARSNDEQPICIVVDLHLAQPLYQIQYTLNSIFLQNYTNYFTVIFGEGSSKSNQVVNKYLQFYGIAKERYSYLPNENYVHGLQNIVIAANEYCSKDALIVYLRSTDELIGRNTLKFLSQMQKKSGTQLLYSNYYHYDNQTVKEVPTIVEQKDRSIRMAENFRLSFAAFTSNLFRKVDHSHFRNNQGKYFSEAIDKALFLPMIELTCSKLTELKGARFLRTGGKSANSSPLKAQLKTISEKKAYNCAIHP